MVVLRDAASIKTNPNERKGTYKISLFSPCVTIETWFDAAFHMYEMESPCLSPIIQRRDMDMHDYVDLSFRFSVRLVMIVALVK